MAMAVALLPAVWGFCVREREIEKERPCDCVCLCACTHALMLPPCCVPPFSLQNSVSTNPWKLRCSEPVAKPFPTEPRPRVCALLYTWLVLPVARLPSLLGVSPSPSLGCSALPNRLLPTIITRAESRTHQHTIKVWPANAHQPSHTCRPRHRPKTRPNSTNRAPVHAWDAPQHCGLGWCCYWVGKTEAVGSCAVVLLPLQLRWCVYLGWCAAARNCER